MSSFLSKQFKGDSIVWIIYVLLIAISALAMFSASSGLAYDYKFKGHFMAPISRHLLFLLAGFALTFFTHLVSPKKIFAIGGLVGYPVSLVMLVVVLAKGQSANGAARWLHLPVIGNFQPSELAKIAVVLLLCTAMGFFHKKGDVNEGFKYYILIIIIPAFLILIENLSTFLLLGTVSFILLYIGGVSLKKLGLLIGGLAAGLLLLVMLTFAESWLAPEKSGLKVEGVERTAERTPLSFVTHRVGTWIGRISRHSGASLTPEEKEAQKFEITGRNQQTGHAHIAVARGKWFGVGIGNSEERDFIPQSYADFIFAIIVEEVGLFSFAIIFLYLMLFYRSCVVLNKSQSFNSSFAAVGLSCMIVVQSFMHIAVTLGIMPVTGQTLPLISRGGTSILITSLYFGIILSFTRVMKEQENNKKEGKSSSKIDSPKAVVEAVSKELDNVASKVIVE